MNRYLQFGLISVVSTFACGAPPRVDEAASMVLGVSAGPAVDTSISDTESDDTNDSVTRLSRASSIDSEVDGQESQTSPSGDSVTRTDVAPHERICAICQKEFKHGRTQNFIALECQHGYHAKCYVRLLQSVPGAPCPVCRGALFTVQEEQENKETLEAARLEQVERARQHWLEAQRASRASAPSFVGPSLPVSASTAQSTDAPGGLEQRPYAAFEHRERLDRLEHLIEHLPDNQLAGILDAVEVQIDELARRVGELGNSSMSAFSNYRNSLIATRIKSYRLSDASVDALNRLAVMLEQQARVLMGRAALERRLNSLVVSLTPRIGLSELQEIEAILFGETPSAAPREGHASSDQHQRFRSMIDGLRLDDLSAGPTVMDALSAMFERALGPTAANAASAP